MGEVMSALALAKDSTIRDVLNTLLKPEEYVRVVIGHMSACRRKHKNSFVRIGITGRGKIPSHKVVYDDPSGIEVLYKAYGEETEFTDVEVRISTWSTARMSYDDVGMLLGEIRGYKPGVK